MADLETSTVTPTGVWSFLGGAATNLFASMETGISAAGTTQSDATALTKHVNIINTVPATTAGVKLPSAVAGMVVLIVNNAAANAMHIWPATGDDVGAGVNLTAATALAAATARIYIALDATNWKALSGLSTIVVS
jgi:hypothetical protein